MKTFLSRIFLILTMMLLANSNLSYAQQVIERTYDFNQYICHAEQRQHRPEQRKECYVRAVMTDKIVFYNSGLFNVSKHKNGTLIYSSNGTYEKKESTIRFKVDQIWDTENGYQAIDFEEEVFYEENGGELQLRGGSEKIWGRE